MDPNENLREQRQLSMELEEQLPEVENYAPLFCDQVARLLELHHALDEWLTRGGALPAQWQSQR